jgi:hypothetical protein
LIAYGLVLVPLMSIRINAMIDPAANNAAHIPELNIPTMAEHPATKSNTHAIINSTNGFIEYCFNTLLRKIVP